MTDGNLVNLKEFSLCDAAVVGEKHAESI